MTTENAVDTHYQMVKPAPTVWSHLIRPRPARTHNGVAYKAQYETTFLFDADHPDFLAIKQRLGQIAVAKFGRVDNLKYPFENGTKIADAAHVKGRDREFLRGKVLFKPHGLVTRQSGEPANPPRLVVLNAGKYVFYRDEAERPAAGRFFYNGCLCVGEVSLVPYIGMGGGVSAYLNEILSLNMGEKINAEIDSEAKYGAADKWAQYVGVVSSVDPTAGKDTEIPF